MLRGGFDRPLPVATGNDESFNRVYDSSLTLTRVSAQVDMLMNWLPKGPPPLPARR
jgi:hypothetical protein